LIIFNLEPYFIKKLNKKTLSKYKSYYYDHSHGIKKMLISKNIFVKIGLFFYLFFVRSTLKKMSLITFHQNDVDV
jgi:hypothetical protein